MHFLYLAQFLLMIAIPIVKYVLRAIGFGFVTYVGINMIIDQAKNYIISEIGGADSTILSILGLMKIDVGINLTLVAVTTRFILSGFNKAWFSKRLSFWSKEGSGGSMAACGADC